MSSFTRKSQCVKSSRKPNTATRRPITRNMDGTSITCPEPTCSLDFTPGSLAWQVETMLELEARQHEAAMVADWEADAEAQHEAAVAAERKAWERKQFGFGVFEDAA